MGFPKLSATGEIIERVSPCGPLVTLPNKLQREYFQDTAGPIVVGGAPGTLVSLLPLGPLDFSGFPGANVEPPAVPNPALEVDIFVTALVLENGVGASTGTLELHADVTGDDVIRGGVTADIFAANGQITMAWSRKFFSADSDAFFQGSVLELFARAGANPCNYNEIGVLIKITQLYT